MFGRTMIEDAEIATGRSRGRCSFEGCERQATVGGHVWIARRGPVLAPICRQCNYCRNAERVQDGGSYLRAGVEVTVVEYTEGMANAPRRFTESVDDEPSCRSCGTDISDRDSGHTLCLGCYRRETNGGEDGRASNIGSRPCQTCGTDISDRPSNHSVCLGCYRGARRESAGGRASFGSRPCQTCGTDISDRPSNHSVCLGCYRGARRGGRSRSSDEYSPYYQSGGGRRSGGYSSHSAASNIDEVRGWLRWAGFL